MREHVHIIVVVIKAIPSTVATSSLYTGIFMHRPVHFSLQCIKGGDVCG